MTFTNGNKSNGDGKKEFKQLNVAIIGGGLGGMAAAVSMRRAGHKGEPTWFSELTTSVHLRAS